LAHDIAKEFLLPKTTPLKIPVGTALMTDNMTDK
jgi:hypothetical protein